jgi:hypothetical protein
LYVVACEWVYFDPNATLMPTYFESTGMLAFQIAKKSLLLITNNFYDVLRICAVLYLLNVIVNVLAIYALTGIWAVEKVEFDDEEINSGLVALMVIGSILVSAIVTLWVAVTWHRYVLLEEAPNGWIPRWNKSANLSYFYQFLKLVLIFFVLGLMIAVIVATSVGNTGNLGFLFSAIIVVMSVAFGFTALKMSLIFPSAAVETNMGVVDSWSMTGPYNKTLLALTVASVGFGFLYETIASLLDVNMFTSSIRFFLNAFFGFWGLSVLTTLYGIIVEGREMED